MNNQKIGRNELCLCGSGKKYKQCCQPTKPPRQSVKAVNTSVQDQSSSQMLHKILDYFNAGDLSKAESLCRQVLSIQDNQPDALHILGLIASKTGNHEVAVELINRALQIPVSADQIQIHAIMSSNLGNALASLDQIDAAIESYQKAIAIKPDYAEAYCNLGAALLKKGQSDAALNNYQKAIAIKPDFAEAYYNIGNICKDQNQLDDAIAYYRKAIAIRPTLAEPYSNLGNALKDQGQFDAAIENYHQSLLHNPDLFEPWQSMGVVLHEQGKFTAASVCYQKALWLRPDDFVTLNCLGAVLADQGQLDAAIERYHQALSVQPNYAKAYSNLGVAFSRKGDVAAAVENFQKALAIEPYNFDTYSNLLFSLSLHPEYSAAQYLAEAKRYGSRVVERVKPYPHDLIISTGFNPQPLRIGLVSGDLLGHPVGYFMESILSLLDKTQLELFAYITRPLEDELTSRIKPYFSAWIPVFALSDEAAAQQIYNDRIHILIDLAGHTAYNRLPVFAWKPAPVQVSWLGYFASTGLPGMDYLLADMVSVPESHQEYYSETVWYLPDTRFCFTPPQTDLTVAPLPAARNGFVTFGCFQRVAKIKDDVLKAWGRILAALSQARLRLQNQQLEPESMREEFTARLSRFGIAADRVTFVEGMSRADYLAAHAEVDIIVDTFPFPGGATTCEALWMGVPTLTLAGDTMIARQGASLLACAGLNDWIANDEDDYVARALAHATDIERLAQLRSGLRQQVLASPLFDAARFAGNLEEALLEMWRHALNRPLPSDSEIEPERSKQVDINLSGAMIAEAEPVPAKTKHLLIAGWRGINHSFCLVNQHQILALARRTDIRLSHLDMPFRMDHWSRHEHSAGFTAEDQLLIDSLPPADETEVDCVLRIAGPLYPPNPKARKTLTFAVTELGYDRNSSLYNPQQDLAEFTTGENLVVTPSRWARDRLLDFGFTEGRVFIVGHGVDTQVFRPLSAEEYHLQRLSLGIPPDATVFLNVGVTTWNEGIDLLIHAFAAVHHRYPNTRLILKDARDLYRLSVDATIQSVNAESPGLLSPAVLEAILTIPGNLSWEHLRWLYGFADWYVAPYRAEGFNLPALEAQACGTPVMVSSGGATDDFCHGDGTRRIASVFKRGLEGSLNGCAWVEPDRAALENLMLQAAAEGPRPASDAVRQAARANALKYPWERVVERLVKLLRF